MIYALVVSDMVIAGLFIWKFSQLPPQIPLLYSKTWGEDQLTDYWFIFVLPFLLHVFIFVNAYLYGRIFLPDQFVKKILDVMNWFFIITLTFIYIKVILLAT